MISNYESNKIKKNDNKNKEKYKKELFLINQQIEAINKKTNLFNIKYMMIKSINFALISNNGNLSKIKLHNTNKNKYNNLGVHYLFNILNNNILKNKIYFYINLLSFYYIIKDNINYINFRKLLSNILLKKIIKKKFNLLKYYFLKYQSKTFSLHIHNNNNINDAHDENELEKIKKINYLQEQKIIHFQNLLNNYMAKEESQKLERNNMISNYQSQIDVIKEKFEKIISKNSTEHTQELMKLSNENIAKRQIINKLNKQIEEQQNLIKNLNEKNKQKEENMNQRIENIKIQYNNFENIIDNLNKKIEELKKENDKYKNKNNELINIENVYKDIKNENAILKNNNENLNNKYVMLRSDYVKMKVNFEKNKKEFEKAIKEMDTYSQLLITLENKMNKAENDKIKAELERDRAIQETKEIRQRYIDIMSNNI